MIELIKLVGSAVITACTTLLALYLKRKWEKQDQSDENKKSVETKIDSLSKNVAELESKIDGFSTQLSEYTTRNDKEVDGLRAGLREMLYDRIKHLCKKYIGEGRIREEDYKSLNRMWDVYHNGLGGNGYLDREMNEVHELDKY